MEINNNLRQRRKEFFSDLQKIIQTNEIIFDDNSLSRQNLSPDSNKNENIPQKQTTNNLPIPSSNDIPLTYFSIQQQFTANLTPKPFLTLSECNISSTSTFSNHNHHIASDNNNIITEDELNQTKAYFLQQLETTNQRLKTDSSREILLQQAPHLFNSTFFKRRNLMIEDLLTKDTSSSD